tara:strand:+ start:2092 stop:2331 length:240 start_codon:yes stop_codon:yes gene_type:complete
MISYIFYSFSFLVLCFVIYIATKGILDLRSKEEIYENKKEVENEINQSITVEIEKLNKLYKDGIISESEFNKAKEKILK